MIDTPAIVQFDHQITAKIHLTIPRSEIQNEMGPAIGELMAVLTSQGIPPVGPLLSHHLHMSPETFDFEISVPVASMVTPSGRVEPGSLPACRVARTNYRGPYEQLGEGWGEFMTWLAANSYNTAENLWECYVKGPESTENSDEFVTELNKPLVD